MSTEALLDRLDPEQRQVAVALEGPVRVIAGAGTGKTRAVVHRIAYGVQMQAMSPHEVLAVTFTTRAAGEMRARLASLGVSGVQARTFHSAALRQLRYFWPKVYNNELPTLLDSKFALLAGAARRQRLSPETALLRDLAAEIEWSKVSNVLPDAYPSLAQAHGRTVHGAAPQLVAHVYSAYEQAKREAQRMDMEDVLLYCAHLLNDDARVRSQVQSQYRHFVVDEFQDVSPLQYRLLKLWLGDRDSLCVVGDPSQTIYSFAGAKASYLLDLPGDLPGATTIRLVRNYRSVPDVVAAANLVIGPKSRDGVTLQAMRGALDKESVRFTGYSDEVAEAEGVAADIATAIRDGADPASIAILVRINAYTEVFEEALTARGVRYTIRGSERFFARAEIRQALTLLRGSARSGEASDDLATLVKAIVTPIGWAPQAPTGRGQARDRWESLQSFVEMVESVVATANQTLGMSGLVEELERRASEQEAPSAGGVTIASLHSAKGLEWDQVYLVGMHEGNMPISYAQSSSELDEELRLLYVGITRARDRLRVSWALARQPGGRGQRRPSRFLKGLVPDGASSPATKKSAESSRARSAKVVACRTCATPLSTPAERKLGRHQDCAPGYDEALFAALKAWRGETAQAASQPAFVVFTDATLLAIAEQRPRSTAELLKIPGIGATKAARYGEDVLALTAVPGHPEASSEG